MCARQGNPRAWSKEQFISMICRVSQSLGFTEEQIASREFMSFEDDAIGIWSRVKENGQQLSIVCFATPEVLSGLQELSSKGTLVLVNHQFFLDQFSRQETKNFIDSTEIVYLLQSLNMKVLSPALCLN